MEANLLLNVKCTNEHLMNYIMDIVNKKQTIPGLEISVIDNTPENSIVKTETLSLDKPIVPVVQNHNYKTAEKPKYNGGWVDTENKSAMQDMFDTFRI